MFARAHCTQMAKRDACTPTGLARTGSLQDTRASRPTTQARMNVPTPIRHRARSADGRLLAATVACVALLFASRVASAQCEDLFGDGFDALPRPSVLSGSSTIQTSDGVLHTYYFRVPGTPAPFHGRPALIWLHGDGGSGNGYATAFHPLTDADGAIMVTPSGINQTWTHAAADLPGQPQDAQFLSRLIDRLVDEGIDGERVDAARIYLGGESRGAYMPYFLLQRPSTKFRMAAVAVNAGLLYCQSGDADCEAGSYSAVHHDAPTPILHLHGTNDSAVAPPPTASFNTPVDWNIDWRVFNPMKFWARQNGCFDGDNGSGLDNGVLRETFAVGANTARRYDLSAHGAACSRYQLVLVTNGGHVIAAQHARIWAFLSGHCRARGS